MKNTPRTLLAATCLTLLIAMFPTPARTAAPPADPILRLETGMHTAGIRRIGVDRAERILVTGSDDKTVRVWDLATGALLKTLRVPMDQGKDGMLYAMAVSPDGRTVAAGGWTGWNWDKEHSIYLFDLPSGALKARISGLSSVISHLAFSRDGRYLAAGLGKGGIRIYTTADWKAAGKDTEFSASPCRKGTARSPSSPKTALPPASRPRPGSNGRASRPR